MAAKQSGEEPAESDVASVGQLVEALREIAAVISANAATPRTRAGAFDGDGFRTPSETQARTALDYRLLSQLMGRGTGDVSVAANRFLDEGADRVGFFDVPEEVVEVSVLAAGSTTPEVLELDEDSTDQVAIVTLGSSADRDILRCELLDELGLPVRIGPAMPRVPVVIIF